MNWVLRANPGRPGHHQGLAHWPHSGHLQGLVSILQNLGSSPLGDRSLHSMLPSRNYAPQTWVSDSFTPRLYDLGQVISHETPFVHCEMYIINPPCRGTTYCYMQQYVERARTRTRAQKELYKQWQLWIVFVLSHLSYGKTLHSRRLRNKSTCWFMDH